MELQESRADSTQTAQMISRRSLLAAGAVLIGSRHLASGQEAGKVAGSKIIDIHQHTNYAGRDDATLVAHQAKMGIAKTVLLPAGSKYGLAANCGKNDSVYNLAKQYPDRFVFFANELPDLPETKSVIENYLKLGAIGIGEQKFHVDCDSKPMRLIADIAKDHNVPVLMHFQYQTYNLAFERFYKMLEAYPTVNFIGHAQTWWANIDKNCRQEVMYPKGTVTPGGITDRLLSDYPNIFGDLSAGSGLNAFQRDEDHGRDFLKRHQDKLLYGSDCDDHVGTGKQCIGAQQIASIRRLAPDEAAVHKMFYGNASKLFKMS